jgi:hypothetical protein
MFDRLRAAFRTNPTTTGTPQPIPDGVYRLIDDTDGRKLFHKPFGEEHYQDNALHRDRDLPARHIYGDDKRDEQKEWLQKGLHDREGGPAIEINGPQGYEARYLRKGLPHNADGPAVVIDGQDGLVREWWKNGVLESRFEEFHGVEPDYQAPGGARGGIAYRQEVFDKAGATIFTAASSTDPFSWGERQERFERRPTTEERVSVEARMSEQRAYFDRIGGMSPWDTTPTMGRFREQEPQEAGTPRPGGVKAAAAAAAAKAADTKTAKPKTADRGDER